MCCVTQPCNIKWKLNFLSQENVFYGTLTVLKQTIVVFIVVVVIRAQRVRPTEINSLYFHQQGTIEDLLETGKYQVEMCGFPVQIVSPTFPDIMTPSDASFTLLLIRAVLEEQRKYRNLSLIHTSLLPAWSHTRCRGTQQTVHTVPLLTFPTSVNMFPDSCFSNTVLKSDKIQLNFLAGDQQRFILSYLILFDCRRRGGMICYKSKYHFKKSNNLLNEYEFMKFVK